MLLELAPAAHRFLVAPERQGQDLAGLREALEALDRDEAVDLREQRPQPRGGVEIGVLAIGPGLGLEDHRDHGSTLSRKVRSSAIMKRLS